MQYGHHAGDALLQRMSRRLRSLVRGEGELFRWGGEEFLLVTLSQATPVAEWPRNCPLVLRFQVPGGTLPVCTRSISFAAFPLEAGNSRAVTW